MASYDRIIARLPMLYRPEAEERALTTRLLRSVGDSLDAAADAAQVVLQSHWFKHASKAGTSAYQQRRRRALNIAPSRHADAVEILDPPRLIDALRSPNNALEQFIRSQLSGETRALLVSGEAMPVQRAILADLHALLPGPLLFEEARFAEIELSEAVRERLNVPLTPGERFDLNIRLLEEGLAGMVARRREDQPYLEDLARLSSLLSLRPRREPQDHPESAEMFRQRISRIVSLYREGVGTRGAIERMVEAELPIDARALTIRATRAFRVEEFAAGSIVATNTASVSLEGDAVLSQVGTRGPPTGLLGPLMRWTTRNTGLESAAPTLIVQGIEAAPPHTQPTERPLIELLEAHGDRMCVGIGYLGALAADQALRIRPTRATWISNEDGLELAISPASEHGEPVTPIGPWDASAGAPDGRVIAMVVGADLALWAAVDIAGQGALWRYDGREWTQALSLDALPRTMHSQGRSLLIGDAEGLRSVDVFPVGAYTPVAAGALANESVLAMARQRDGQWLIACESGLLIVDAMLQASGVMFEGIAAHAIHVDRWGNLFVGGEFGLVQQRAGSPAWHALIAEGGTEQARDWAELPLNAQGHPTMPDPASVRIPPVLAVHRTRDGTIWLGTTRGIVRYVARSTEPMAYETAVEAFPDLVPGEVSVITEDSHDVLWILTDRGAFRFDRGEFSQRRGDAWVRLGRADVLHDDRVLPRGSWRFTRSGDQWERLDPSSGPFTPYLRASPRTTEEPAAMAIAWSDEAVAEIGAWDGAAFTPQSVVPRVDIVTRIKPDPTRIVASRFGAMPRVPIGDATWRFLSIEPDPPPPSPVGDRATWTTEGRLLPPSQTPDAWSPGRFDIAAPPPPSEFDESVFAYPPCAKVWMSWSAKRPLGVLVRLERNFSDEVLTDPLLDRVWQGVNRVRPAGIRASVAVENVIVRGEGHG